MPGSKPATMVDFSVLQTLTGARVGTCPHCGYPSLESGLCAYCRPHVAG